MANNTKIYMQEWLNLHSYQRSTTDDQWYLDLSHQLLTTIHVDDLLADLHKNLKKQLALSLAVYLEDAIAQKGGWIRFKKELLRLYNRELPFYELDDSNYISDEINIEDIQFILWTIFSLNVDEDGNNLFIDPFSKSLKRVATEIYETLDEKFEEAPVTAGLSLDWIMDLEQLNKKTRELPTSELGQCKSDSAKKFLTYTQGEPLQFFDSYTALKDFFVNVLEWENKPEALMPEMEIFSNFVLYANTKGLLMAPDAAIYFDAPHNKLFDKEKAVKEGYVIFCEGGNCPFDLIKYGMKRGLLDHIELPIENGKDIFRANWDFISRWYLGEFYEGD